MMPDHGRGAETDRPTPLPNSPADIHVISGDSELGIESADRLERRFTKSHVAAGNVLGLPI